MRLVLNYGARLDGLCRYCRKKKADCHLVFKSLFYNHFTNWYTCMDTLMEPFYWFVDHFARYLGPILVILVVIMVTSVVVIFYTCLLPEKYFRESWVWTAWHLVFGHWMLVNVVFNYFMAAFTHPGRPPTAVPEVVSICKKCISPKPPRSHHCSICKNCILKMDHHCPWLNNCVGHYNHRYFFLFCVYIWAGCMYVCVSGYDLFKRHFYGTENYVYHAALYPLNMAYNAYYHKGTRYGQVPLIEKQSLHEPVNDGTSYSPHLVFHHCVLYEFMLCSGVGIAVGLLTLWHIKLISSGQTSIEVYINHKERKRMKEKGLLFKNPYHFGFRRNWRMFFGLDCTRSFWRHVLLPSSHSPTGNGLRWETSTYKLDDLTDLYVL